MLFVSDSGYFAQKVAFPERPADPSYRLQQGYKMSKILVCEDQDSIRKMIQALVGARGHVVIAAQNGAEALELATNHSPDLALLDLTMPGEFDGFEVCRRLRALETTSSIPIIIVTALDDDESRKTAKAAGATAYFTKPFSPIGLLGQIQNYLVAGRG